jgi:hypothetical protein
LSICTERPSATAFPHVDVDVVGDAIADCMHSPSGIPPPPPLIMARTGVVEAVHHHLARDPASTSIDHGQNTASIRRLRL